MNGEMKASNLSVRILAIIFLRLYLKAVLAKSNFEITYNEINCTRHDPKGYLAKISCGISKNLKRSSLNAEMQFKKNVKQFGLDLRIVLPRQSADFVLLNLTRINGCQLMANKLRIPFMQLVISSLKRYGNLVPGCPYKRDTLYYLRGLRLDLDAIPMFAFETDMKAWVAFLHEGDILYTMFVSSRIQLRRSG